MSLVLQGVEKSVAGVPYLYATNLEFAVGLNVVIGRTQAGKTTLLRVIAGLDKPDSGRVLFRGVDLGGLPLRQRRVAMVYQQFVNYPAFTVYDNIASPLRRSGLNRAEIDRRVREVAELLGIDPFLARLPSELSGGQQQRTAIARALVKDADILLFDEPLVNLDYKLREDLRRELRTIFAHKPAWVIYATTEPAEALALGGYVAVLDQGRVLQHGPALYVYRQPAELGAADVLSDPQLNTAVGRVGDGSVNFTGTVQFSLPHAMSSLEPGDYRFAIRAHQLALQRRSSGEVSMTAQVALAEVSGSETFVHVRHGELEWIVQLEGVHSYRGGDAIQFYFDPAQLLVFAKNGDCRYSPALNLTDA